VPSAVRRALIVASVFRCTADTLSGFFRARFFSNREDRHQSLDGKDLLASTITTVEKWLSNFRSPSEKVAEVFVTPLCWAKPSERSRKQAH
jgi:hypothetical protein